MDLIKKISIGATLIVTPNVASGQTIETIKPNTEIVADTVMSAQDTKANPMPIYLFRRDFIKEFSRHDWKVWRAEQRFLEQSVNFDSTNYARTDPKPMTFLQRHKDYVNPYIQSEPKIGYHRKK